MKFHEAFNQHIKGKVIKDFVSFSPFGDNNAPVAERFYGEGIETVDGYKFISYGGGCSGEDCNTQFIVSPENKLMATDSF